MFSALARHWEDFIIIMVLLVVNGVIGFWEEYQAGQHHRGSEGQARHHRPGEERRENGSLFPRASWCRETFCDSASGTSSPRMRVSSREILSRLTSRR